MSSTEDRWLAKLEGAAAANAAFNSRQAGTAAQARYCQALEGELTYVYLPANVIRPDERTNLGRTWRHLACVQELQGASAGQAARFHYVVETDVLAEHADDLEDWYRKEHLLGLAAVPGTVRASRYVDVHGSPRYYACYDLVTPDALVSPAWLAVRATAWSDRVRPAFRNTRRTMFRIARGP